MTTIGADPLLRFARLAPLPVLVFVLAASSLSIDESFEFDGSVAFAVAVVAAIFGTFVWQFIRTFRLGVRLHDDVAVVTTASGSQRIERGEIYAVSTEELGAFGHGVLVLETSMWPVVCSSVAVRWGIGRRHVDNAVSAIDQWIDDTDPATRPFPIDQHNHHHEHEHH